MDNQNVWRKLHNYEKTKLIELTKTDKKRLIMIPIGYIAIIAIFSAIAIIQKIYENNIILFIIGLMLLFTCFTAAWLKAYIPVREMLTALKTDNIRGYNSVLLEKQEWKREKVTMPTKRHKPAANMSSREPVETDKDFIKLSPHVSNDIEIGSNILVLSWGKDYKYKTIISANIFAAD